MSSISIIVPGVPHITPLCTVVVFSPPANPNGIIQEYELRFGELDETIVKFGANASFYITTDAQRSQNVVVEVGISLFLFPSPPKTAE